MADTKIRNVKTEAGTKHPDYSLRESEWERVRDCMKGEKAIKDKKEKYLPRPAGMDGEYALAYEPYIERAHFPLIVPYALSGALGVIITKLPEFNLPKQLEYLVKEATNDGRSLRQLFLDTVIEIFQTGRVPLVVDTDDKNVFKFVQYKAESLINWKTSSVSEDTSVKSLTLAVLNEQKSIAQNVFSHEAEDRFRVLTLEKDTFVIRVFDSEKEVTDETEIPMYMGNTLDEIPLIVAGSINNAVEIQPIPLVSVANCSVQIYRKEADLANSEFLSCNPTLIVVGADNPDDLPNVVGSSVMMIIANEAARVFYTTTDTAALTHVKEHIKDLYDEAIRHGVAILDARKGVEAAEALRIRQATQSASLYSIYLSALSAIVAGLKLMCKWAAIDPEQVTVDAPTSLTFGIPESALIKELVSGFAESGVIPLSIIHNYLISSGLLDQKVNYDEFLELVKENEGLRKTLGLSPEQEVNVDEETSSAESSADAVADATEGAEETE